MEHSEHVALIREGIHGRTWAEFGSGRGAFMLALAEIIGPEARLFSVDRDPSALSKQREAVSRRFPGLEIEYLHADFTHPLSLPRLDGILMANSLHFVPYREQVRVVRQARACLRPGGRLVVVEYDTERGNMWVPHPFRYARWMQMAEQAGFTETRQIGYRPGSFLEGMYAAESRSGG